MVRIIIINTIYEFIDSKPSKSNFENYKKKVIDLFCTCWKHFITSVYFKYDFARLFNSAMEKSNCHIFKLCVNSRFCCQFTYWIALRWIIIYKSSKSKVQRIIREFMLKKVNFMWSELIHRQITKNSSCWFLETMWNSKWIKQFSNWCKRLPNFLMKKPLKKKMIEINYLMNKS